MDHQLKVIVVEDDWAVRSALSEYLARHELAVSEADSAEAALAVAAAQRPDVAVLDIVIPERAGQRAHFDGDAGITLARALRKRLPELGIVFLSAYADRGPEVIKLFMEGNERITYLLKGSRPQELLEAIQRVAHGLSGLEIAPGVQPAQHSVLDRALEGLTPAERAAAELSLSNLGNLSQPERRVFDAIGACQTQRAAAERLNLSPKTVGSHMEAIYRKLGLQETAAGLNPLPLLAKIHLLHQIATEASAGGEAGDPALGRGASTNARRRP